MNKFDWNSFPLYHIDCSDLNEPSDICEFFKKNKIDKYVYTVLYKDMIIVKIGMSAAKSKSRLWGERVYRQLAHAYSWGESKIEGSSGADWLVIERAFERKYKVKLDHRKLTIAIWDVTNYDFQSLSPFKEVEAMESEKINDHINLYGDKPIGNINDEASKRDRSFVVKKVYNNIFTEVDDE